MKKRILVTGGAGFLGSHLCDRLLREGHSVVCADNLSTGSAGNIAHLRADKDFTFIHRDILQPFVADVEEIYHFACPASPKAYQRNPIDTTRTSVLGTLNMLDLALRRGAKFLLASTSEVYGDPLINPQHEDYWGNVNPIGPRSCYDEGKRCAETLVFDHIRQHGLDAKIIRVFNTYGPRMLPHDGRVVSNFIVQALTGQDITIFGDGRQTRSFCFIDDTIEATLRMMAAPSAIRGPINIGNPAECTIKALAELVVGLTKTKSGLVFLPAVEDDPRRRQPDIGKARRDLAWQPTVPLHAGLARTIAFFEALARRQPLGLDAVSA
ncbi:MAG: UDP-glucuronic acid decarboxylase family protein [Parvibaculaceae bacterium]